MPRPRLQRWENAWFVTTLAVVVTLAISSRLPAAAVITGDVTPALPWNSSTNSKIGITGVGMLSVKDGSELISYLGTLGDGSGSSGAATITGTGSKWTNSSDLYVGRLGAGSLTVEDGGQVLAGTLYASLSDLHGDGTITATGAVLDANMQFDTASPSQKVFEFGAGGALAVAAAGGTLGVGYKGSGNLAISEGVSVFSNYGSLGVMAGSSGTSTISGAGSVWYHSQSLSVGISGSGAIRVEAGGRVTDSGACLGCNSGSTGTATIAGTGSTWFNQYQNGKFIVGESGSGALRVEAGGQVSSYGSYLGYNSGSTGTATISGMGSKWTTLDPYFDFTVGDAGNGAIRAEAGGQVISRSSVLGDASGSIGAATITGPGSKWINSADLYVGRSGSGTLTVEDGGQVTAATLYASLNDLHGNGTIAALKGAILDADMLFNAPNHTQAVLGFGTGGLLTVSTSAGTLGSGYKGNGILTISGGAAVANSVGYLGYNSGSLGTATITGAGSKWASSSYLYVGLSGGGALRVESGGQVSNAAGYLGSRSGSSGTATITGPGSKWTNSSVLFVGALGGGDLTVEDGGQVMAATLYASLSDLHGDGTIIATTGAVLDADMQFNATQPSQAVVEFGAGGTLTVTAAGGNLGAGYKGNGNLTVSNGASISSLKGYLGYDGRSTGTATITGTGSKWTNSSHLYVGLSGGGALRVESGGQVSNDAGYLGYNLGTTGTATITGPGSKWTNNRELHVGETGSGELRVEAGGEVSNTLGYLGGKSGTATITGPGSRWTNGTYLYVGSSGSGALRVEAGGQVSSSFGYLGFNYGSTGLATITGLGSKWINSSILEVGRFGRSTLTITDGGLVSVGHSLTIDSGATGNSVVNLASGGMLALRGNAQSSLAQFLGLVSGTDAIRYWSNSLSSWMPLTAAGLGSLYTLQYQTAGDLTGYTLLTVLAPGPPGDFDGDGRVGGGDFLAWQRGNSPMPGSGSDLATWRANFGVGAATPVVAAVPEPATLALFGLAFAGMLLGRRRLAPAGRHGPAMATE